MEICDRIINLLKSHTVDYQEFDHKPVYSSQDSALASDYSIDQAAKCLLLKAKDQYVLIVLPGSKKLESKKLKHLLAVKEIRFASPAEVMATMGCVVGACFPFGKLAGLTTYMDRTLLGQEDMYLNPGLHEKTIKMKLKDYLAIEKPIQVDISA